VEVLYNETIAIFCAVSLRDYNQEITWHRAKENLRLDDPKIPVRGMRIPQIYFCATVRETSTSRT
jgi:hypothetical protein